MYLYKSRKFYLMINETNSDSMVLHKEKPDANQIRLRIYFKLASSFINKAKFYLENLKRWN